MECCRMRWNEQGYEEQCWQGGVIQVLDSAGEWWGDVCEECAAPLKARYPEWTFTAYTLFCETTEEGE